MIIGIDSMILIYADIVPSKPGPKCANFADLRARAKLLFYRATDKDKFVLPTVVMSELLVPVPKSQRGPLILALQRRFICPPLDIRAASIAAEFGAEYKKRPQDQSYTSRDVVRADALIVASAFAGSASHFCSHDAQCRTLAKLAGMEALDLPTAETMEDQFLLNDIRTGTVPAARQKGSPKSKKRPKAG